MDNGADIFTKGCFSPYGFKFNFALVDLEVPSYQASLFVS